MLFFPTLQFYTIFREKSGKLIDNHSKAKGQCTVKIFGLGPKNRVLFFHISEIFNFALKSKIIYQFKNHQSAIKNLRELRGCNVQLA